MNKDNISILKFSQVEIPEIKESKRNTWIEFGLKNNFPDYLIDLSHRSALHNAILTSKTENICGNGVTYTKENELEDIKTEQYITSPNPYETLDEIVRKITWDLELFGGYYLNVIWSKDKKSIAEIYHLDFNKVRSGLCNENGQVEEYYYSDDWNKYRTYSFTPKAIPAYNTKTGGSQILFVKPYNPGQKYYPLPAYIGALAYIEVDSEIANFHLAHIKNGMNPSLSITFTNGVPTEEERNEVERKIATKYNSTDNAGKFILNFVDDKDKAPIITTISPSQLDKQFIQLSDQVLQNILSGHRVTSPLLVGIREAGSLGGSTELYTSYQIYKNTVIEPHRKIILDTLNKIGKINGCKEIDIINSDPVDFTYSESTLLKIKTKDEMRSDVDLDPLKATQITVE